MEHVTIWISLGIVIIVVLAIIAAVLQYKVYQLNKQQKAQEQERLDKAAARRREINQSIQIIAQAIGQDDKLTLTEASIRISGLLDILGAPSSVQEEFSAFYQLTSATSHIPYLTDWKALSKQDKWKYTLERERLETDYKEFILHAAERIRGRDF